MTKYHLTEDGPKICTANKKPCKYGETQHYEIIETASKAFENQQQTFTTISSTNASKVPPMPLNKETELLTQKLSEQGYQPLLVGGCVRDHILGKESKDIDIEIYGSKNGESLQYNDLKNVFKKDKQFKINEAGASFSVLKVKIGKEDFDLALPRTEQSTGDKHTDYNLQHDSRMDYSEAASRRDFTINSIAYNPITKTFVDPYNGQKDLKTKTLRHISDAFSDDPLRCLRAVNFASRFDLTVAPETRKLCQNLAPTYKTIAHERVVEEFNKMFNKGDYCHKGLTTLYDIGWSKQIDCFKNISRKDFQTYGEKLNKTPKSLRKTVLTKLMNNDKQPDPTNFLMESIKEKDLIEKTNHFYEAVEQSSSKAEIIDAHRKLKNRHSEISNQDLKQSFKVLGIDDSSFSFLSEQPTKPVITGDYLIEKGVKPSPQMGKMLKQALIYQDNNNELNPDVIYNELFN